MDNLKERTKKAFVWDFAGRMTNQGVAFVVSMFLARLITPAEFGLVAMINVIIAFSSVFMDMGLGISLVQRKEINNLHLGSVFWFNLIIGIFLTGLLYFSAPLVAQFYEEPQLIRLTRVLSFIFIINAFGRVVSARLTRNLELKIQIVAQLIAAIISGSIGIIMAYGGYGIWALVIQGLIGAGLDNLLLIVLGRFKPVFVFSWQALKELWKFGMRMFLSGIIDSFYSNLDAIMIGKLFNAIDLGFYNRAKNMNNMIIHNATGSLNRILLPSLSALQSDNKRFQNAIDKSLNLSSFLSFLVVGLFFVVSKDVILIFFGNQWEATIHYFRLILLSAYVYPISVILVNVLASKGKSKQFLRLEICKKIIITINFLVGFVFGIDGFIIGLAIVYSLALLLNIVFASKEMNVSQIWFHKNIWIYFFISVFASAVSYYSFYFLNNKLWLHTISGGGSFLILFLLFNMIFKTKGYYIFVGEFSKFKIVRQIQKKIGL